MIVLLGARRLSQALSIDGPPKTLEGPRRGLGIALHGPDDLADFLMGRGGGVGGACDIFASAREDCCISTRRALLLLGLWAFSVTHLDAYRLHRLQQMALNQYASLGGLLVRSICFCGCMVLL
jgi:hypothetical protein